jgi:hypothetical protein
MDQTDRLTDAEAVAIRRRRPGVRASLVCEGMRLAAEEEALFEPFDREHLTPEQRHDRLLEFMRTARPDLRRQADSR